MIYFRNVWSERERVIWDKNRNRIKRSVLSQFSVVTFWKEILWIVLFFPILDDKDWPPRSSVIYGGGSASLTSHQAIYSSLSPLLHFTQLTSTIVVSLLFGQLSQLIWYRWWFGTPALYVHSEKTPSKPKKINVKSKSYVNNYDKNHHDNNDDYLVVKILLDKFPYKNNELYHLNWHHYHLQSLQTTSNSDMTTISLLNSSYHVTQINGNIFVENEVERMVIVVIIIIRMRKKEQIKNGNRKSWQERRVSPLVWTNKQAEWIKTMENRKITHSFVKTFINNQKSM